jgi:hypothetical protein
MSQLWLAPRYRRPAYNGRMSTVRRILNWFVRGYIEDWPYLKWQLRHLAVVISVLVIIVLLLLLYDAWTRGYFPPPALRRLISD